MNLSDVVKEMKLEHEVLCVVNLDQLPDDYFEFYDALKKQFMTLYKNEYNIKQRLIFTYTEDDYSIAFEKNIDQVPFNLFKCSGDFIRQTKNKSVNNYVYGSPVPWKISV